MSDLLISVHVEDGQVFNSRQAIDLLWPLLYAIADLLGTLGKIESLNVLPNFSHSSVSANLTFCSATVLFDSAEDLIARTAEASELLWAAENLFRGPLVDRMLRPGARLPIPVVHDGNATELLRYDHERDVIFCRRAEPEHLIEEQLSMLKALSSINAAGLSTQVQLDGRDLRMPDVSPTAFGHGTGPGRTVVSTGLVTGLHHIGKEVEIRIEDCKKNKVIRARLDDPAHAAIGSRHPPFAAALAYFEPAPLLPLLPITAGKITIERMWDFQEQSEFQFPE